MINVKTRQFYFHNQNFEQISTIAFACIGLGLNRLARSVRPELYLYSPTQNLKILLILISVFAGTLSLWLLVKKRYQPLFEDYMRRTPEEVKSIDDISKILVIAQLVMLMIIFLSLGMLIWSIVLFSRFFDDSNLATYSLATTLLLGFSYFFSRIDHAVFILMIAPEMKSKIRKIPASKDQENQVNEVKHESVTASEQKL